LANADYILEAEDYAEYSNTVSQSAEKSRIPANRKINKCKLINIPAASNIVTAEQIDAKIKEIEPSYNKAVRSGIIGNMFKESSLNTNAYGPDGAICGSYGLVQWRSSNPPTDRQDDLSTYCEKNKLDPHSLEGQVRFLIKGELQGKEKNRTKELLAVANNANGAREAAFYFASKIERCGGCMKADIKKPPKNMVERQNHAEDIFNGTFKY